MNRVTGDAMEGPEAQVQASPVRHGSADSLRRARDDEHAEDRRQPARQGRRREDGEADRERTLRAIAVAEAPCRQEERRERQRVCVHHPLQIDDAASERGFDLLQRHVHHGDVELHDDKAEARPGQGLRRAGVGAGAEAQRR